MNVHERLENAYKSGGAKEVLRKGYYLLVYKFHNQRTLDYVRNTSIEEHKGKVNDIKQDVIVSMTTFPPRFEKIGIVIKSILLQNILPNKIVIYLDGNTRYEDLTDEMKGFQNYGVEYRFHNETLLKCHSKYFFAMNDFPDSIVVTTDDDVILPPNWLESLINSYKRYPDAVSARRVHLMRYTKNGFLPYNQWFDQWRKEKNPSNLLFATGVGGVLYPPHLFRDGLLDDEMIKKLSYENDDIWLKCWEILSGVKVVWAQNNEVSLAETEAVHEIALSNINVNTARNDKILNTVLEYYDLTPENFI